MKTIKVSNSNTLFEDWMELSRQVGSMWGIVQNDTEISVDELKAWHAQATKLQVYLRGLIDDTMHHATRSMSDQDRIREAIPGLGGPKPATPYRRKIMGDHG